jgi:ribose transport system substrate-binding protein
MRAPDARPARRALIALLLAALLIVGSIALSACGGGDDSTSSSETSSESGEGGSTTAEEEGGGSSPSFVAAAKEAVEVAEEEKTEWKGPAKSPPPAKGKSVFVIGCSADVEGCVRDFDAAAEAAEEIGWKVTKLQTDGSPQGYNEAYKRAIDSKVDGILSAGIPSPLVEGPLKDAASAGIAVVSMAANNEPEEAGANFKGGLYAEVGPNQEEMGAMAGDYIVAESNGEAKYGVLNDTTYPVLQVRIAGFKSAIEKCDTCEEVGEINVPVAEIAQKLAPASLQFFRANPDLNYLFGSYDGGNVFASQAARQGGSDVKIVGQDGSAPNLDMIREGGPEVASAAYSLELIGWASVDQLNRAFSGEAPAPEWMPENGGIQLRLIVEENAPPKGPYVGDFEFEENFRELWGIG